MPWTSDPKFVTLTNGLTFVTVVVQRYIISGIYFVQNQWSCSIWIKFGSFYTT